MTVEEAVIERGMKSRQTHVEEQRVADWPGKFRNREDFALIPIISRAILRGYIGKRKNLHQGFHLEF